MSLVAYVNHQGGLRSPGLHCIAVDLGREALTVPLVSPSRGNGELGSGPPLQGGSSTVRMATAPSGLCQLLQGQPWEILLHMDLLSQMQGTLWHPEPGRLQLWVWPLNGTVCPLSGVVVTAER
ncbi:UNVERIFIED_CONTAM: hypothetical protein FKN15_013724 [Acipenser sinensis]